MRGLLKMNRKLMKILYKSINDIHYQDKDFSDRQEFLKDIVNIFIGFKKMNLYYIDVFKFVRAIKRQIIGWNFFLGIVKQVGDYNNAYCNVLDSKRPNEGQVAFFDLGYGFPKELYDKHWCFVLKDFGSTFVILPLTSVKDKSKPNPRFEIDIEIKNFELNNKISRLHVNEIRTLDVQRLDTRNVSKPYDVITNKEYIVSEVNRILLTEKLQ